MRRTPLLRMPGPPLTTGPDPTGSAQPNRLCTTTKDVPQRRQQAHLKVMHQAGLAPFYLVAPKQMARGTISRPQR